MKDGKKWEEITTSANNNYSLILPIPAMDSRTELASGLTESWKKKESSCVVSFQTTNF